ncbi:aspartate:alanine exchanger family transporter [Agarivorans albus]|uniref:YidE/YbjL duplication n=1 Tax=Agarivorans albus MKT 106 TaxID=1331007 RepID=R9PL28_AGAAL|nr:yidE/YbjL duplication [Agarivorans albus]GAD02072.1 yidE/YbjL duplication [Agarivorans albus MKT 106]
MNVRTKLAGVLAAPPKYILSLILGLCFLLTLFVGNAYASTIESEASSGIAWALSYLASNPFAYLFLTLAIGYPIGRITVGGINLGATAGTLVTGILIALASSALYGITYDIPGLVEDIFLMLFMYALGMRVGPQFFSGLARGGVDFLVIGLIVVFSNFLIVFFGVKVLDLGPGYAAGIISGSYTVTAVMGVAQSAVTSGAFQLPEGVTADTVGANMAAGYAISYVLSSIFIILLIKYLPKMFGKDAVLEAQKAEQEFSGGEDGGALPGTAGTSILGFTDKQIRSYKVEHAELVGKSVSQLFKMNPHAAILKVVRGDEVIDAEKDPSIQLGDIVGVLGDYNLLLNGKDKVGKEVSEPRARMVDIEVADIHVGKTRFAGKTLAEMGRKIGFGLHLKSLFRAGVAIPHLPKTIVEKGDVLRLAGPAWCVEQAAKSLKATPIVESAYTEVSFMSLALFIGFVIGHASVEIGGIPFALGTSAGCMLMGILVSWLRTRNPDFGGPTSEGARAFLNDIGLSLFVAVLAAGVGPKIMSSFQGTIVLWIAVLGLLGALVPPFLAWLYGYYIRKMNPVILAGACAGGRNSTPALNGIQDISQSGIAAVAYPVPYALTSAIVLILGYMAMVFS